MSPQQFKKQRRDLLKSTCTLAGASALWYRVSPDKIPAEIKDNTVKGIMAYSAVCTHLGFMLSNWDAATKQFLCPCHDALFDPLKAGANTVGPLRGRSRISPLSQLTESWWFPTSPVGTSV